MLQKKWVAPESLCQWDREETGDPISIMGIWQPNDAFQNLAENDWPSSTLLQCKGEKTGCGSSCSFCATLKATVSWKPDFFYYTTCHPYTTSPFHELLFPFPCHTSSWLHFHDSMVVLLTVLFLVHRNQPFSWGYFGDGAITSASFNHFSSLQIQVVVFQVVTC